jgi:predicted kinase
MILEPDQFYHDGGRYVWSQERCDAAWAECYRVLGEALARRPVRKVVLLVGLPGCGKSRYAREHDAADVVMFDGLFVDRGRRRRVVEIARAAGVPVEAVWFQTDWDTCAARNAGRSPDRQVPAAALECLREQLAADPPTIDEGFAALQVLAG